MHCAIWYHLHNLKNVKNTHGGVLILKPTTLLKLTFLHGYFSRFLYCTNGTKSCNAPHISSKKSSSKIPCRFFSTALHTSELLILHWFLLTKTCFRTVFRSSIFISIFQTFLKFWG